MSDAFANFTFSESEAQSAYEAAVREVTSNRSICICGHPSIHHVMNDSHSLCSSKNIYGPCSQLLPVLDCEDLRFFSKSTRGEGVNHALSLGISASLYRKKTIKWLIPPVCMRCQRKEARMRPVPIDRYNNKAFGVGYFNVLACLDCLP